MGIVDFVTGGAKRMMIARPDSAKSQVVYKHPDQTFPFWSQLTVDSDEVCLFFKDGQFKGQLSAGRHTLDTQNIPFLNNIVDRFTGGNVYISELFFVTTSPIYNEGFGGPVGSMRDPELDLRVNPRVFGSYSFRVADPTRFIFEFWRQRAGDSEVAMQWIRDQLVMGVRTTLTRLIKSGDLTMMDLGTAGPDVARAVVQNCPDLAGIGLQILEIAKLNINLSEEDQSRVDEFQDQIVQAKVEARKAKIAVARVEAEAQARQIALDQDFANRMRYANQMDMGRYQQYAAAEATLGMGEGLAHAGPGSAGAAGAQMVAGMGLAAGLAAGARPFTPPSPQGYVVGSANPAGQAPVFCSGCGSPVAGKFCSNCGQPLAR